MASKCKYGRTKAGTCRKTPRRRKKYGSSRSRTCRFVRIKGRKQRMCKKGRFWRFAKAA